MAACRNNPVPGGGVTLARITRHRRRTQLRSGARHEAADVELGVAITRCAQGAWTPTKSSRLVEEAASVAATLAAAPAPPVGRRRQTQARTRPGLRYGSPEYTRTQSTSMLTGNVVDASGAPGQLPPTATLKMR